MTSSTNVGQSPADSTSESHKSTAENQGSREEVSQVHLDEWVKGSGVSEAIAYRNLISLADPKEIAQLLNWGGYKGTPGWCSQGIDPSSGQKRNFGQFKPDQPIQFPDSDKAQKYFSFPKGAESEAIYLSPDRDAWQRVSERYRVPITEADVDSLRRDLGFWRWVMAHPEIPVALTEGVKKAACLLTQGYVGIALTGVWNGQKNKKDLIPTLKPLIVSDRQVFLVFDADVLVNPQVQEALKLLGHLLIRAQAIVLIVHWELEQGKGCDDFIVANGVEKFEQLMNNATPYSEWLKGLEDQFRQSTKTNHKRGKNKQTLPPQDATAYAIAECYRAQLAWHSGQKSWFRYSEKHEGIWSEISEESVGRLIMTYLRSQPSGSAFTANYVRGVASLLKNDLEVRDWHEQPGLIPLQDGVLELKTRQLLNHAPGYHLLWCLPYRWADRTVGCQPIQAWILEAMKGKAQLVEVLRAFLNAVLTGRLDLQRYLELIGPGGTGKGTYMRLVMALVGPENTAVTTLEQLERNRFETAGLFGKRLLLITDSERYGGEVSVLKGITGGDPVRYEKKNVQQTKPFIPSCMVIVASNEPVQSSDYTSGLERRRLTVPFVNQVRAEQRRDLDAEFKSYLPGLLDWVLAMPDEQVTDLVRNTQSTVTVLAKWKTEMLLDTNPMAEWLDHCIVMENTKTYVGVAKRDKSLDSPTQFQKVNTWLYASYCEYMAGTGSKAVSSRRFTNLLHDLCVNQLKLEGISRGRDVGGSYFQGLAIRRDYHPEIPPLITGNTSPPDDPHPDGNLMVPDGNLMAETIATDGTDGSDGFFETQLNQQIILRKNYQSEVPVISDVNETCSNPSEAAVIPQPQDSQSSGNPSVTRQEASGSCHKPAEGELQEIPRAGFVGPADGSKIRLPAEYPGTTGLNQTQEPKQIAKRLQAMECKADWEAIVNEYGEMKAKWVHRWYFSKPYRKVLAAIAAGHCEQGKLDL